MTIKSLGIYPNMRVAVAQIDDLYARYLKENKRKAGVSLTVASCNDIIEIRCWCEPGQETEAKWFEEAVK